MQCLASKAHYQNILRIFSKSLELWISISACLFVFSIGIIINVIVAIAYDVYIELKQQVAPMNATFLGKILEGFLLWL